MLSGENISIRYDKNLFLMNVSVEVRRNECLGIVGHNGSGKSTLMSALASMKELDSGQILVDGKVLTKEQKKKIGYVPQECALLKSYSVQDNIKLWCAVVDRDFSVALQELPQFLGIEDMLKKRVDKLSGGMKKKVAIAIALMQKPQFLILDEVFAELDEQTSTELKRYIKEQLANGMGIICSSHNKADIKEICTRVIHMQQGKIMQ